MELQLSRLLGLIEANIDTDHCKTVDERYKRALRYDSVDRPPLTVQAGFGETLQLPAPWDEFKNYSYRETFENPAAMLQNMLLARVVPGIILKDDSPLAIRNNHGTVQISSILGGKWGIYENNYPWVDHFESTEAIEKIISEFDTTDIRRKGILPHSFETLEFYQKMLSPYPVCKKMIQVSMPDLQGPIDTAEQLWGSDIYYAFYENPDLLGKFLSKIVDTMLIAAKEFRGFSHDRVGPDFNTQHGYVIPGRILIRNDSSIMISPDMYREFVSPHDARLLKEIGGGSIHFCGNGSQLVDPMLEIPDLKGLDFGQPDMMDIHSIYPKCEKRKVAITNLNPSREDIVSGDARRSFPTGVVFVYHTKDMEDAKDVVGRYKKT